MSGRMTLRTRKDTRHGFHALMTVGTCGVWAFTGWPAVWLWHRLGPRRKTTVRTRGQ